MNNELQPQHVVSRICIAPWENGRLDWSTSNTCVWRVSSDCTINGYMHEANNTPWARSSQKLSPEVFWYPLHLDTILFWCPAYFDDVPSYTGVCVYFNAPLLIPYTHPNQCMTECWEKSIKLYIKMLIA